MTNLLTNEEKKWIKPVTLPKELKQANQLMREGKINEALEIVLDLEKTGNLSSQDLISCKLLIGNLFRRSFQFSKALKYVNQVLDKSKGQVDPFSYLDGLLIQAHSFIMMGEISQGNYILKQAEDKFENLKRVSNIDLRERESFMVRIRAISIGFEGGINQCLKTNERALELAKDSDDKVLKATCFENLAEDYQYLGDYDKALIHAKKAIEVRYPPMLFIALGRLIEIFLVKGDVVNAKFYFQQMSEVLEKDQSKRKNLSYNYYQALVLKTSLRARDRIKAEELFKKIVKEKESFQYTVKALINLCGLLLIELSITNDSSVINEIEPYITMLLNVVDQQHTYLFAAETYLLQGKFFLLTFDIKKAKRFLIQAKQITSRFRPSLLTTKIAKEYDDLLRNEDLWRQLKEQGAPLADRVALARLHEQIEGMVRNPTISTVYYREEKVTMTKETKICLICRGEVLRFTYICKCGAIYCDDCARAVTDLENVCWVCDIPIDYSKPVKRYKKEPEKIQVDKKRKTR